MVEPIRLDHPERPFVLVDVLVDTDITNLVVMVAVRIDFVDDVVVADVVLLSWVKIPLDLLVVNKFDAVVAVAVAAVSVVAVTLELLVEIFALPVIAIVVLDVDFVVVTKMFGVEIALDLLVVNKFNAVVAVAVTAVPIGAGE